MLKDAIERNRARQQELYDKGFRDGQKAAANGYGFVPKSEPKAYIQGFRVGSGFGK